jgi:hypothetical protein
MNPRSKVGKIRGAEDSVKLKAPPAATFSPKCFPKNKSMPTNNEVP